MLHAAERDLVTLRPLKSGVPDKSFGFHVQQATEKAFKSLLALWGRRYPLTHNLHDLFALLDEEGVATSFFRPLSPFTPNAVEFRCEGVGPGHEPIDCPDRNVVALGTARLSAGHELVILSVNTRAHELTKGQAS